MALSNNALTPNFIYTYKDKQRFENTRKVNQSIFAGILFFLAVCFGLFLWGNNLIDQKKMELARLQTEIENFKPLVNKNLIVNLASKTQTKRKAIKQLGEKYKSIAIINEISAITPSEIRLLSISANMGDKNQTDGEQANQQIEMEGVGLSSSSISGSILSRSL